MADYYKAKTIVQRELKSCGWSELDCTGDVFEQLVEAAKTVSISVVRGMINDFEHFGQIK
jgi:hypothetical protein